MSTLSSSSTLAEVQAAYDDNASYLEDDSVVKAKAFVTAVRILLRRTPSRAEKGSNAQGWNHESLRKELEEARDWLEDENRPDVTYGDVRDLRDYTS